MRGRFEDSLPKIEIEVNGQGTTKKVTAIIDTGSNGYLTLPYVEAFPLGLRLVGIEESSLADGNSTQHLVCRGTVTLDGVTVPSLIDVHPKGLILMGNQLLRALKKRAIIDVAGNFVELVDSVGVPITAAMEDPEDIH